MSSTFVGRTFGAACILGASVVGLRCTNQNSNGADGGVTAQAVFVAHNGALISYDIGTGNERPGTVSNLTSPTDMQSLEDGTVLVNLTGLNQVLAVNGRTMLEMARLTSSATTGTRPVHSYLSPERNGKRHWVALNDGQSSDPATSSARFIDIKIGSPTFLQAVGEVRAGIGHHKAGFSNTTSRIVISNISDCDNVLSVYDYSDVANIRILKTWSARDLGWDGSSRATTCDPTFVRGAPPAPHGCATSKVSGKIYCNLTQSGDIVAIDVDAAVPSQMKVTTRGSGSGYTRAHKDGRYVYSLEATPREAGALRRCQIGQLVVIDSTTDTIAREVPLLYRGPGCTAALTGTDEETAEPGHILLSKDSKTLYIGTAGGFGVTTARVRQELVVDITDPANPVQRASVQTGASTGHHGDTVSGDGRFVFVTNNVDGTVTQIDTATNTVARTLTVRSGPQTVSTFGSAEGPSEQTGPIL